MTLPELLTRFDAVKQRPNGGAQCRCPAHDDKAASLSIDPGKNGGSVVRCFAGCDTAAIVAAAGLTMADLMPPKEATGEWKEVFPTRKILNIYPYADEAGNEQYQAFRYSVTEKHTQTGEERFAPKKFNQRRADPDKQGAFIWNLKGVTRVLYRLPEVLKATQEARRVYVVEGEKDADRLRGEGLIATTNAGGGAAGWLPQYTESLRGAQIVVIPDNDPTGKKHAGVVAAALEGKAASVRVLELPNLPPKGDVSDWLNAGGTVAALNALADAAPLWEMLRNAHIPAAQPLDIAPDSIHRAVGRDDRGSAVYLPHQVVEILRLLPGYAWEVAGPDTHAAMSYRIALILSEQLRYCSELGFLCWNGRHWERDDKDNTRAVARAAELSKQVREEGAFLLSVSATLARAGRDDDSRAAAKAGQGLVKHSRQVENIAFLQSALTLAADRLRVSWEAFTPKPFVLGFANGTWDKGKFREHQREDYMLSVSPVAYLPCDNAQEWNAVLSRMTGGDADFGATLQQFAGYALSGASHLRLLPWAYGPRGTGKSTYAELLTTVLGREGASVDPKYLSEDIPRERLGAALWGKRLIICGEAGEQRISGESLKQLSGGDSLPVRFLYKEAFDAPPRHVLLMAANDPPVLNAYDDALKARVKALPLIHSLAEPEPLTLTGGARIEAVRKDAESPLVQGFAAWAVAGLAEVLRTQTVYLCPAVEEATAKFWQDTDPLTGFWETVPTSRVTDENGILLPDLEQGIPKTDLRRRYEIWCEAEGVRRPLSPRQWFKACEARGLEAFRLTDRNRTWAWRLKETQFADITDITDTVFQKSVREKLKPYVSLREKMSVMSVMSAMGEEADSGDESIVSAALIRALVASAKAGKIPLPALPLTLTDSVTVADPAAWVIVAEQRLRAAKKAYPEDEYLKVCAGDIAAFNALALWWHDREYP